MDTVSDQIRRKADETKSLTHELLVKHSALERDWNVNNPNSAIAFISAAGDHTWNPLSVEGRRLQSRLRGEYDRLLAILRTLLRCQPPDPQQHLEENAYAIQQFIDQHDLTWTKTIEEAVAKFNEAIDAQVELVVNLYDAAEGEHILVSDTNALLYNPALEDWAFDGSPKFTLILIPTVLSELDRLKVDHRNENVRSKAEGLIRRIKGYRSRGRLPKGVPLRTNRSTLRSIAVEPDMDATLPWLKADNNDDRILAGVVEVMRQHPRCPVLLVTRDLNLQNKAEFAGLPFVEPPEPLTSTS